jgi:hypothetical protein
MIMHQKPTTLDELEEMVRQVQAKGCAPISGMRLAGPSDAVLATLAWIGLMWGRNTALLKTLAIGLPLVQPLPGVKFARRKSPDSDEFAFTADGFDQLKSTLYYELHRRLVTLEPPSK